MTGKYFRKKSVIAMLVTVLIFSMFFSVSAETAYKSGGTSETGENTVTSTESMTEFQDVTVTEPFLGSSGDPSEDDTVKVTLEYDDILYMDDAFPDYVVMSIENLSVSSYVVSEGVCTGSHDINAVSLFRNDGSAVAATGVGESYVDIVKKSEKELYRTGEAASLITLDITVVPATLTVVYAAGQSNMEGTDIYIEQHPEDSIVCDRNEVYSVYAPSNDKRGRTYTGIEAYFSSVGRETDVVPGNISNSTDVTSVSGKELVYPLYGMSEDGLGKTGPDSGFAYTWNSLTSDKVLFANAAYAGTSINQWEPGSAVFEHASLVFSYVRKTYEAEIKSGHFQKGKSIFLWMQGESNVGVLPSTYNSYFTPCLETLKNQLEFDCTGIILPRVLAYGSVNIPLRLVGARNYQGYITRQENDIFMVSTINEEWITDEGVKTYFQKRYGDKVTYPLRSNTTLTSLPTKASQVNDDVHFSQLAHNENGIDAAYNMYCAVNNEGVESAYHWISQNGDRVETDEVLNVSNGKSFALSLRTDLPWRVKGITFRLDSEYLVQKEGEDTFIPQKPGYTTIGVYRDEEFLFEQDVFIQYETPAIKSVTGEIDGIRLTWDEVAGNPEYYRVFIKNGSAWKTIAAVDGTSFLWTGAEMGETYTFTIRCADEYGNYTSSYDSKGWTFKYELPAPVLKDVSTMGDAINISWGAVEGAEYYRVFIKNGTAWKGIAVVSDTSYLWTDAQLGNVYTFTVRCVDENGKYISSFDSKGLTLSYYLGSPELIDAVITDSGIKISWKAVEGADKYRVFRKNGTSWKRIDDVSDTSYLWTDAEVGNEYTFTVRCIDDSGRFISTYDTVGVTVSLQVDTPVINSVTGSSAGINISWNDVDGAKYYKLFIKNGTSWKTIATADTSSYIWKDAIPGTEYTFTVRAADSKGRYVSQYDKTGYTYRYYLDTPVLESAVMSEGDIKITWDAVPGAGKYRLFYKGGTQTTWKTVVNTSATSYVFNKGTYNTEYTFTVRCLTDAGDFLSGYDSKGISCRSAVDMPVISNIKSSGTSVVISWNEVENAGRYKVFYKNGTSWKTIGTTTDTTYTFKDAEIYKSYLYTVRCVNSGGNYVSAYDTAGTEFTLKLDTPVLKSAVSSSSTSVTVTWGAVDSAEKYRVFYKIPDKTGWKRAADTVSTSYTVEGLEPGQTYTFTVRCIDSNGNFISDFDAQGITVVL